jgi:hypothetical protein
MNHALRFQTQPGRLLPKAATAGEWYLWGHSPAF